MMLQCCCTIHLKLFDFEVLLQPFEKEFYLPSILVKFSYLKSGNMHCIGNEHELSLLFLIPVFTRRNCSG